jgi:hypothetical protein
VLVHHVQVFNLLADVIADRPVPPVLLTQAVRDLMLAVGPAADGIILFSRRRLMELIGSAPPTGRRPRWSSTFVGCA